MYNHCIYYLDSIKGKNVELICMLIFLNLKGVFIFYSGKLSKLKHIYH